MRLSSSVRNIGADLGDCSSAFSLLSGLRFLEFWFVLQEIGSG